MLLSIDADVIPHSLLPWISNHAHTHTGTHYGVFCHAKVPPFPMCGAGVARLSVLGQGRSQIIYDLMRILNARSQLKVARSC